MFVAAPTLLAAMLTLGTARLIPIAPPHVSLGGPAVTHAPAMQFCPARHARPQAPQLELLLDRSTQLPPQNVVPPGHVLTHAPAEQAVPAPHARPHNPQLALSTFVFTSHPSATAPLQFAKPALQLAIPHAPPLQDDVALGAEHTRPHAPQFVTLLARETSQPFAGLPSQLPNPALHAPIAHAPSEHDAPAFAKLHTRPHEPQFATLTSVFTSQPSGSSMLQSANPRLHTGVQFPALQNGAEFARVAHTRPHTPQLASSVAGLTHIAPHRSVGGEQIDVQVPLLQTWPTVHRRPHTPQLLLSIRVSTSQPFAAVASQSVNPAAHVPTAQRPATHAAVAFASMQRLPHAPQFTGSVAVFTSQPSVSMPLQLPNPVLHWMSQVALTQTLVALARMGQAFLHIPQLPTLSESRASQPFAATMSQSPYPAVHSNVQRPIVHWPMKPGPLAHALPHIPQCVPLLFVSVSQPFVAFMSQLPKPMVHDATEHSPAAQPGMPCATVQPLPQIPQCVTFVCVSTHMPLQHSVPAVHAFPHIPQWLGSLLVSTHTAEQHVDPAPHAVRQPPVSPTRTSSPVSSGVPSSLASAPPSKAPSPWVTESTRASRGPASATICIAQAAEKQTVSTRMQRAKRIDVARVGMRGFSNEGSPSF